MKKALLSQISPLVKYLKDVRKAILGEIGLANIPKHMALRREYDLIEI